MRSEDSLPAWFYSCLCFIRRKDYFVEIAMEQIIWNIQQFGDANIYTNGAIIALRMNLKQGNQLRSGRAVQTDPAQTRKLASGPMAANASTHLANRLKDCREIDVVFFVDGIKYSH
jgi:hypothetical protein